MLNISFLTIREGTVYFIHHSAKDFLSAHRLLFPKGRAEVHCEIVSRSLQAMDETLDRDIYGQQHPGVLINEGDPVNRDPLDQIRYSCAYWIDHVSEIDKSLHYRIGLHDNGEIDTFLKNHFLHWLEALSLMRDISSGVALIKKLEKLLGGCIDSSRLLKLV